MVPRALVKGRDEVCEVALGGRARDAVERAVRGGPSSEESPRAVRGRLACEEGGRARPVAVAGRSKSRSITLCVIDVLVAEGRAFCARGCACNGTRNVYNQFRDEEAKRAKVLVLAG